MGFDMSPWEGHGAHYVVGDKSEFEGRRVMIIGGGDSALEWALNLLDVADSVTDEIEVDQLMRTSLERVWACGDIATFEGKLKLIATGFAGSAIAVAQAVHEIRPEVRIQSAYSTNTGVPGVVAGQP
jgi:thioredoxin reductase